MTSILEMRFLGKKCFNVKQPAAHRRAIQDSCRQSVPFGTVCGAMCTSWYTSRVAFGLNFTKNPWNMTAIEDRFSQIFAESLQSVGISPLRGLLDNSIFINALP